jgi:hypothetical protein
MGANAYNHRTCEPEAGGWRVQGPTEVYSEFLHQNKEGTRDSKMAARGRKQKATLL